MSSDLQIVRDEPSKLRTPYLRWHRRGSRRVAYSEAPRNLVKAGFTPKDQRVWSGTDEPTQEDWKLISSECRKREVEMRTWKTTNLRDAPPGSDPEDPGPTDWRGPMLVPPPLAVDWGSCRSPWTHGLDATCPSPISLWAIG
jgi:hypothetical protein